MLGVPGLMEAVRSGNVTVANALGSGLVESAAPAGFLPGLCRRMLGEELKMPAVATWWCGEEAALSYVVENLSKLVIKPAFPIAGVQPVFGALLSAGGKGGAGGHGCARTPSAYVAQEQVPLSTVPVWEDGRCSPRHLVLRVYAVASGGSYSVMPGGLTRVTASLDRPGGIHAERRRQQRYLGGGRGARPRSSACLPPSSSRWMSAGPLSICPAAWPTTFSGWAATWSAWSRRCAWRAPFCPGCSRNRT